MRLNVYTHRYHRRLPQVRKAVDGLNGSQTEIFFDFILEDQIPYWHRDKNIDPKGVINLLLDCNVVEDGSAIVTDCSFFDNWFSHTGSNCSIVSCFDWDAEFAPPALKTFVSYELIMHAIACSADLTEEIMMKMSHHPPVGCAFDFCEHKNDIKYKLVGGQLCPLCSDKLLRYGVSPNTIGVVRHLLDDMRLASVGSFNQINLDKVFVAMRFSKNDPNENSYLHGVKPAFAQFGLLAETAAAQTGDGRGMLIEKIRRMIDEAWAVVILLGENNLNLYFEYGYALAKSKPLMLVCPQSRVNDLPTDVKGYELIVYPDQDFISLQKNLVDSIKAFPRFAKHAGAA